MANSDIRARDYYSGLGYTVDWDEPSRQMTLTQNGKTYIVPTEGLTNRDGSFYGTRSQLDSALAERLAPVRDTAQKRGINVNYDEYGHALLNGQSADDTNWVNVGDRWYAPENELNRLLGAVEPESFSSYFSRAQKNLLNDLVNYGDYSYDPSDDTYLQQAMELARRKAMRSAENRGQGSSFGMEYSAAQAANALIPEYEEKAYDRYRDGRDFLTSLFSLAGEGVKQDLEAYKAQRSFADDDRRFGAEREDKGRERAEEKRQYDLDFDEGRRQFETKLAETVREFDTSADREEREFKEKYLLEWAKHRLDGMGHISEEREREFTEALNLFAAIGEVRTEKMADILGLPVGTTTLEAAKTAADNYYTYARANAVK